MSDIHPLAELISENVAESGFVLDGRTVDDLLDFFSRYCAAIPFAPAGTWDDFFFPAASGAASLAALYQDETKANGLLAPQQAFLLAFLRLLETPRALLNSVPAMHRQLYYRDLLGLRPRPPTPDQVVLAFAPDDSIGELSIPAGAAVDAGQDAQGRAVQYALDSGLLINHGRWTDLRWTAPDANGEAGMRWRTVFDEAAGVPWAPDGVRLFGVGGDDPAVERGLVVGSPVLAMSGGVRTVTLVFANAVDPALVSRAFLSGADKWLPLALVSKTGTALPEVDYRLEAEAEAVVAPSGLDDLTEDVPLCKVFYTAEGALPVVESISVAVDGLTDVVYAGGDGVERTGSRSYPFGSEPVVGSTFMLAAADWYHKDGIALTVTVQPDWIGLPPSGFPDWYAGYPGKSSNNDAFQVETWVEQAGERTPAGVGPHSLFATGTGAPQGTLLRLVDVPGFAGEPADSGDPVDWPVRLSFELTPRDFLHSQYQQQLSVTPDLNPPYTPQVGSLRIGWSAAAEPSTHYQLTPFGHASPDSVSDDGPTALYLGFTGLAAGQDVSLYWRLRASQTMQLSWQYLDRRNEWVSIDTLVSDRTRGLFESGGWSVALPGDASDLAWQMPRGRYWIRAVDTSPEEVATDGTSRYPWLLGLLANAGTATLVDAPLIDPSHFDAPLPAGTITRTVTPLAGLGDVTQPWPSTGGRPAESDADFNLRIADRLLTRNRVVTWNDMVLMLRDRFPEVFNVYTPPIEQISILPPPGQQVVVVVPVNDGRDNDDRLRPAFTEAHLASMQSWLQTHASLWTDIVVRNAEYRSVDIRYEIAFAAGVNPDYGARLLKNELSAHYMPWAYAADGGVVPGNVLDYYGMVAWIQQRPYVGSVIALTLDGGTVSVEGAETEVLILNWPDDGTTTGAKGAGDE